ncbi:MAG TPA: hypothetical protein VJ964_15695 [Balneolaceae bacterium]|nr:hypothetical protein [Balneolaceae bacterium]
MDVLKKLFYTLSALLAVAYLSSCSSVTSNKNANSRQMKITMTVGGNNSFTTSQTPTTSHHDTNNVKLDQVKLLVHHLELGTVSLDSLDFELNNLIVNLPLSGDTLAISDQQIPAGSYNRLDIEIDKADVQDSLLNDSTGYYSIAVKGTYNGQDFLFRSKRQFLHEFKFDPPIDVTDSTKTLNLNLSINVDKWFRYADPTNPDDQARIEQNIANSFNADCRYGDDHEWRWHGEDDDHYGDH